jgi:DGQHR domain-containing protein
MIPIRKLCLDCENEYERDSGTCPDCGSGNTQLCVYAMKIQQYGVSMFAFRMDGRLLHRIVDVHPGFSSSAPKFLLDTHEAIQRRLDPKRAEQIATFASEINQIPVAVTINLYSDVDTRTAPGIDPSLGLVRLIIPSDGKRHAYCIDGQHRLAAFDPKHNGGNLNIPREEPYDIPVVAFYNLGKRDYAFQFVTINYTQISPDPNLVITLDHQHGTSIVLTRSQDKMIVRIMKALSEDDPNSPLHKRVYFRHEWIERGVTRWAKIKRMWQLLGDARPYSARIAAPYFRDQKGQPLKETVKTKILRDYFEAWSKEYTNEGWDSKTHVLTNGSIGIAAMCALFPFAFEILWQRFNGTSTVKNWRGVLRDLKTTKVDLREKIKKHNKPIDWRRPTYGQLCQGEGNIGFFVKQYISAFKKLHKDIEWHESTTWL